jgi:eukaryotic-like serine/threonine-protein kinase
MAEVFCAHDELLARDVAIKVFRTHPGPADSTFGVQRQQLELQALARLNHPNLITLYDGSIAANDGPAFLVMELINGPSLAARIAEGPLPEPQVRELGVQIADALAFVHAEGMIHRDVKPGNILLGSDRATAEATVRARLSDFGIVRLMGSERLTSAEFTLGTASYLAPEQARGSDVGPPADVYALGLVLIEALSGVRSYDGPPLEVVMARLDRGPELPGNLPAPWPSLLAAMTALDPDGRPSAAQVADTLRGRTDAAVAAPILVNPAEAADAPTVGLAALDSAEAAAAGAAIAPASLAGPDDDWIDDDDPAGHRRGGWILAAAAAVVAVLAVAAFALLRPTAHHRAPADRGPVAPTTHQPAGSHAARRSTGQAVPANDLGGPSGSSADNSPGAASHARGSHGASASRSGRNSAPNPNPAPSTGTSTSSPAGSVSSSPSPSPSPSTSTSSSTPTQ